MLSIILTILKIIGIIILVILGIIIFLLMIIGFVPVRYRGNGTYKNKTTYVEGRATWLLHIITLTAIIENEKPFHICLKLLGIRIYDSLTPAKIKKNKKSKKTKNKSENIGEIQAASITEPEKSNYNTNEMNDGNNSFISEKDNYDEYIKFDDTQDKDKSKNIIEKVILKFRLFLSKIVEFFKNITFTFHKICDTIDKVLDNIKYYLDLLQLDTTKLAFTSCKKQLLRIFKGIMPKKYQINLHLGFDDPAVMGEVLAVWGMLYPFHQGNINLQPEFEQKIIEGDFYFKGKVSIYIFVQTILTLLFDKNFKLFIKQLKAGR